MVNYDGIRVIGRNGQNYVVEVGEQWYYYDSSFTLRGPYQTRENAINHLRKHWDQYGKLLEEIE